MASNSVADLRRREADIAVRNVSPSRPELVGKKIGDRAARLYAAPAYLESIGNPKTPDDLSRADFFAFDRSDIMIEGLRALGVPPYLEELPHRYQQPSGSVGARQAGRSHLHRHG